MPDFDLTGELSLKIELHMLRPITEKVHSGNGPVSLVPGQAKRASLSLTWNRDPYKVDTFGWSFQFCKRLRFLDVALESFQISDLPIKCVPTFSLCCLKNLRNICRMNGIDSFTASP